MQGMVVVPDDVKNYYKGQADKHVQQDKQAERQQVRGGRAGARRAGASRCSIPPPPLNICLASDPPPFERLPGRWLPT